MSRARRSGKTLGRVRIIAGQWRGRRIPVADVEGLRPTPDRLRETLFNWIAPLLPGAVCLDLFAGSGALGLEAASRGAAEVVMVEREPVCVSVLGGEVQRLQADNVSVVRADALAWLRGAKQRFNFVFVDPPYAGNLLEQSCALLFERGLLTERAFVYLEQGSGAPRTSLPPGWQVHRESRAGHALGLLLSTGED